jgi:hypothetical protein
MPDQHGERSLPGWLIRRHIHSLFVQCSNSNTSLLFYSAGRRPQSQSLTRAGALGHFHRNAGFIQQPQCGAPACRMNPAFRLAWPPASVVVLGYARRALQTPDKSQLSGLAV